MATMVRFLAVVLCSVTVTIQISGVRGRDRYREARCNISNGTIKGSITLKQNSSTSLVQVIGQISGLSRGPHGFHLHVKGDLSNGCNAAGAHYNPFNKQHGGPNDENRHVGDLGNIYSDNYGTARINILDRELKLSGEYSILDRTIVVHEKRDDLGRGNNTESKINGNSGRRLGCCIITSYV